MSSSDSDASDTLGASVASDTSVRSYVVVAIRPEDLTSACTTDCSFTPFPIPARDREIRGLPEAPLDLFF
ncbi:hypothetical protein CI238_13488 [Colletotrichum incanum]|uniref:Uncharacterized protein n=1 Tax=Colletotrichum incanum TaxID=1573173 RepID=A0A166ZH76_COLIC|nr:hypothetical protein CI238_13488 [Colletotrichum incanum]